MKKQLAGGTLNYIYAVGIYSDGNEFFNSNNEPLSSWNISSGKFVLISQKEQGDVVIVTYMLIPNDGSEEVVVTNQFDRAEYQAFSSSVLSGLVDQRYFKTEA